jgi:N-acetylneuraminate synthase
LPRSWIPELAATAQDHGIEFMCTGFSASGVTYLNEFVNVHKVASAECGDKDILLSAIVTRKPVLISTGAASQTDFDLITRLELEHGNGNVIYMECVPMYPAPIEFYRLDFPNERFRGLSDHTLGYDLALMASSVCTIFEKHFDAFLGYRPETPDSPVSISPDSMAQYVKAIHQAHYVLGHRKRGVAHYETDFAENHKRKNGYRPT